MEPRSKSMTPDGLIREASRLRLKPEHALTMNVLRFWLLYAAACLCGSVMIVHGQVNAVQLERKGVWPPTPGGGVGSITKIDERIYCNIGINEIAVFDATNPVDPQFLTLTGFPNARFKIAGYTAYLATLYGLEIYDLADVF